MDQDQVQRVGLLAANQVKLVKTNRGLTKAFISGTIIRSILGMVPVCTLCTVMQVGLQLL